MIKAIFFDLDGTLLNTLDDLADAVNFALASCDLPTVSKDKVRQSVGNGVKKLIERVLPETKIQRFDEVFTLFREYYSTHSMIKTAPYEGIVELLERLKERKLTVVVISNKYDAAVKELMSAIFGDLVTLAVGESNTIRPKPCPDGCNYALTTLGFTGDEVLFIGDSDVDMMTAKAANLKAIGVTWGFRDRQVLIDNGAKIIIDEPNQLLFYIDNN